MAPRRFVGWIALLAVWFFAATVEAGEIPTVTLGTSGPDKNFDLQQSFYLAGEVPPDAESVHVVFVRYRYSAWGIPARRRPEGQRRASTCAEVKAALQDDKLNTEALKTTGVMHVKDLWPAGPTEAIRGNPSASHPETQYWENLSLGEHRRVLVAPAYTLADKKDDAAKKWKILVGDKKYFRPGARYCMFVIVLEKKTVDKAKVATFLKTHLDNLLLCTDTTAQQPKVDACVKATPANATGCPRQVRGLCFQGEFQRLLGPKGVGTLGLEAEAETEVRDALRASRTPALIAMVEAQEGIGRVVAAWKAVRSPAVFSATAIGPGKAGAAPTNLVGRVVTLRAKVDPIAEHVLLSLAFSKKVEQVSDRFEARRGADTIVVDSVTLSFDETGRSKGIGLSGRATAGASRGQAVNIDVGMKLGDLPALVEGSAANLEDLVQFLAGRIPSGNDDVGYVAAEDLLARVPEVATGPNEDLAAGNNARKKLVQRTDALLTMLQRAGRVARNESVTRTEQLLADALERAKPVTPCAGLPPQLALSEDCGKEGDDDDNRSWWSGFRLRNGQGTVRDPLEHLVTHLVGLAPAAEKWSKARTELETKVTGRVAKTTADLAIDVDLTQQAFFDTYLTEIAGVAWLPFEDSIATAVVGVQVFFYPNSVDEPMWTNGGIDARRLVGLELALRPNGKAYGPNDRYGTLPHSRFPPLFLGGVLQLIPYTTVDLGVALFGYRRSPLTQERAELRASFYVGLSAEFNFAGIVRKLASGTSPAIPNTK